MDRREKDLYAPVERAMLEGAISGGREGRTGEELYCAGMRPLLQEEKNLRGGGYVRSWPEIRDQYYAMRRREDWNIGRMEGWNDGRLEDRIKK